MNLVELTRYTNDEERAEIYLREQEILKTFEDCPYWAVYLKSCKFRPSILTHYHIRS